MAATTATTITRVLRDHLVDCACLSELAIVRRIVKSEKWFCNTEMNVQVSRELLDTAFIVFQLRQSPGNGYRHGSWTSTRSPRLGPVRYWFACDYGPTCLISTQISRDCSSSLINFSN